MIADIRKRIKYMDFVKTWGKSKIFIRNLTKGITPMLN